MMMDWAGISGKALVAKLVRLRSIERRVVMKMLWGLVEVDGRRLHLKMGYSSLFMFCREHLGLPKGTAWRRSTAAELLGPLSDHAALLWDEVRAGKTREARFVKLCDRLQLGIELVALLRAGRRGLEEFEATVRGLDCAEFEAVDGLRLEILGALGRDGGRA